MSVEENKAVVRRYYNEVVNGKKWDLVDELLAPDFEGFKERLGNKTSREQIKQTLAYLRKSSPDHVQTVEDLIAEGDKVSARWTIEGTHQGDYLGVPGSGKRFRISGIEIFGLRDGQIVEHWFSGDVYGFMQQVGAIPPPSSS
jgi:steroid delta-isomerase-like uncharacterized protein